MEYSVDELPDGTRIHIFNGIDADRLPSIDNFAVTADSVVQVAIDGLASGQSVWGFRSNSRHVTLPGYEYGPGRVYVSSIQPLDDDGEQFVVVLQGRHAGDPDPVADRSSVVDDIITTLVGTDTRPHRL